MVAEGEEKEVRTCLQNRGSYFDFVIMSQTDSTDGQWQTHARGEITALKVEKPVKYDLQAIETTTCNEQNILFTADNEAICNGKKIRLTTINEDAQANQFIKFGPRWKSLRQVQFGKTQALALLELSEDFASDIPSYQLHPALLDDATGITNLDYFYPFWQDNLPTTGFLSIKEKGAYYLPFYYKGLKVKGILPKKFYSCVRHVENAQTPKGMLKFNISLIDERGIECVAIEEYTLKKVELSQLGVKQAHSSEMTAAQAETRNRSSNVVATQKDIEKGLLPSEGIEVFNRILGSTVSQIIVSTHELHSRFNMIPMLPQESGADLPKVATHPRPQLNNAYVAPRNELEEKLATLWQQCLGVEPVGVDDDFFELGGDSLIAVSLIALLRETFQTELSAQSLFNTPTIATLAKFIEEATSATHIANPRAKQEFPFTLVEFQPGNPLKKPLFLIHPVGGLIYFYRELAHHLGSEQPVYGLQAPSLDGKTAPLTNVEEMATTYINALRIRQPEGPYFLGGSSFGGMIAFEMAQQLRAEGHQVALVTLIDTPGPGHMPVKIENDAEILAYFLNVGSNVSVSLADIQALSPEEQLRYFIEQRRKVYKKFPELDLSEGSHVLTLFKMHSQAMWNYTPQDYSGQVIFFRANDRDAFNDQHPEQAWVDLVQELTIIEVPGNHITMNFPPNIQVMAENLKPYLP
jgi:thioesterase domain-containing protein/acyl carrier protein